MVLGCAVLISMSLVSSVLAIPVFARKYRTSCGTCHIGFPKLTPFAEAFRQNGYQIPAGDAAYVKEEPVALGAAAWRDVWPETWKKLWPKQVWPGTIPSAVPIAFSTSQSAFIWAETNPTVNFFFPIDFRLLSAGVLGDNFSFWANHNLQFGLLGRSHAQFNDLFLEDSWGGSGFLPEDALNLRIGRLEVGAIGFPLNTFRTYRSPSTYGYNVADGWSLGNLESGFEANGVLKSRFKYAIGAVNGTGGVNDENDEKDYYGRIAYKFGGLSFDGKDWGEGLKQSDNWVDNAITLGLFGYWGTSTIGSGASSWENDFRQVGMDARFNFGNLDLYGAYVQGLDKSPPTSRDSATRGSLGGIETSSWFVEADYVFYPWLSGALRYEQVNYDKLFHLSTDTIIANLLLWPRPNIKLTVEGFVVTEDEDGGHQLIADLTYLF